MRNDYKNTLKRLSEFIKKNKSFLILSHQHPDGDSVGSCFALKKILSKIGKKSLILNTDPMPYNLRKIKNKKFWKISLSLPSKFEKKFDGVFVIECPNYERTGYKKINNLPIINIDHHVSNKKYGDFVLVVPEFPCIGIIIYDISKKLGVDIDTEIANYLYISLVTDTGQFCYENSNLYAFDFALKLVKKGAKPNKISKILYEGIPAGSLKLKGLLLSTLEIFLNGKVAILKFPKHFLEKTNSYPQDAEGVIDEPRKIEGVEVAVMLREEEENKIKISLRSEGKVNVEKIATKYGGGGHKNAAGFSIDGNFEEAKNLILKELEGKV